MQVRFMPNTILLFLCSIAIPFYSLEIATFAFHRINKKDRKTKRINFKTKQREKDDRKDDSLKISIDSLAFAIIEVSFFESCTRK